MSKVADDRPSATAACQLQINNQNQLQPSYKANMQISATVNIHFFAEGA